jgi:hypothetical protein
MARDTLHERIDRIFRVERTLDDPAYRGNRCETGTADAQERVGPYAAQQ